MTRALIPSGALGLGYDRDALAAGVVAGPDLIAIDGGLTDSGPRYLGTASSKYSRASTKAEWAELMAVRRQAGVPLVIGTAGTCGVDANVEWMLDITREIAAETGEHLRIAVLKSEQRGDEMAKAFEEDRITALAGAPPVGAEQIQAALEPGNVMPQELGILAIVTAESAALASEVAKMLNPYLLHQPLTPDEPMPTFAFPFSPPEMVRGEVYEFCLNHVLELKEPMEAFRLEVVET